MRQNLMLHINAARFQAVCVAWSWFRQNRVISARPAAGNASRWCAQGLKLGLGFRFRNGGIPILHFGFWFVENRFSSSCVFHSVIFSSLCVFQVSRVGL